MEYFFSLDKLAYLKGPRPDGCILCLVRDRDERVSNLTVWEDDLFLVSVNLYPYNPGHLIVFPRRHVEDLRELTESEERRLADVTKRFLDVLDETHSPAAFNLGYNMGLNAGASIPHLHQHIIPRYPREIGISDVIAGKHVLVETPLESYRKIRTAVASRSWSETGVERDEPAGG